MAESSPNPFVEIARDLERAVEQFGGVIVEQVREDLRIPVQYVTGPRGGVRVIRSKPGEHPRRETGNLQGSINHYERHAPGIAATEIDSPVGYAEPLENSLNRIIFQEIPDDFESRFVTLCGDVADGNVRGD